MKAINSITIPANLAHEIFDFYINNYEPDFNESFDIDVDAGILFIDLKIKHDLDSDILYLNRFNCKLFNYNGNEVNIDYQQLEKEFEKLLIKLSKELRQKSFPRYL